MKSIEGKNFLDVAEVQLIYRSKVKASLRPKISGSLDAYQLLKNTWDHGLVDFIEQFKVLLLNRANKAIGLYEVSSGTTVGTLADPRSVFVAAIKANASGVIVCHNHPSGNLTPSQADINLTKDLQGAGKILQIPVLDHLIITSESYYSFADEGLL